MLCAQFKERGVGFACRCVPNFSGFDGIKEPRVSFVLCLSVDHLECGAGVGGACTRR